MSQLANVSKVFDVEDKPSKCSGRTNRQTTRLKVFLSSVELHVSNIGV